MSRRTRQPRGAQDRSNRFAAAVLGAVVASLVWLVVVSLFALTPHQAKVRRAEPDLPPPSVVLRSDVLRQVAWYGCERQRSAVSVVAPAPPSGYRPVVTSLAHSGAPVRTGTELAEVAGRPLVAVVTGTFFYRDLALGDRGGDVQGFEEALHRSGVIRHADGVLDRASVAAWRRFDATSPADRVRLSSLVAVPGDASVTEVLVAVGEQVAPGAALLAVTASDSSFSCEVPDPTGQITPSTVVLEVAGHEVALATVLVRTRSDESPGAVVVRPTARVSGDDARLGIEGSHSTGPVLVVPLSAVTTDPGGRQTVVVLDGATRRRVRVSLGSTANGLVAIEGKGLRAGVEVQLFDQARPGATGSPR